MKGIFQPEALVALEFAMACLAIALLLAFIAFLVSLVIGYLLGLICGCANVWPAIRCAIYAATAAMASMLLIFAAHSVFASQAIIDLVVDGGMIGIVVGLLYSWWKIPSTTSAYLQKRDIEQSLSASSETVLGY